MIKIYRPYGDKRPVTPTHAGNRFEPEYQERLDKNGHPYLEQVGERDVYAEIQSHAEEGDIHAILARYAAGDFSVMRQGGVYIDASQLPNNMVDMFNLLRDQKEKFMQLPLEIREKFGHSFEAWASTAGSEDWTNKMGLNQAPAEEVKQNEPEQ